MMQVVTGPLGIREMATHYPITMGREGCAEWEPGEYTDRVKCAECRYSACVDEWITPAHPEDASMNVECRYDPPRELGFPVVRLTAHCRCWRPDGY
jgi:hypothetical protein